MPLGLRGGIPFMQRYMGCIPLHFQWMSWKGLKNDCQNQQGTGVLSVTGLSFPYPGGGYNKMW